MDAEAAFEELAEQLVAAGCRRGKMMGRPMLAAGRRMVVFFRLGCLGVRLKQGTEAHEQAMALAGSELFRPGRDRVFWDWVLISGEQVERWPDFAFLALEALLAEQ